MATEAAQKAAILAVLPGVTFTTPSPTVYHSTVAAGDVISQTANPPANSAGVVAPDAVITLTVSLGPFPVLLSRWTGGGDNQSAAAAEAAVASGIGSIQMVCLVFLDIPGDPAYLNDSGVNLNWDGHLWVGLGQFGSIEAVSESLEVLAQPVKLTLSGVDPAFIAAAMNSQYHNEAVTLYVAVLDRDTLAFTFVPEQLWDGLMDVMSVEVGKGSGTISVACEHRLRRQPAVSRYTDEDQRTIYPTDIFFNQLHRVREPGKWGVKDVRHGGGGGGSTGPERPVRPH